MPVIKRPNKPDLHYVIDDYTDPWRNAPYIWLQHGFGRSSQFWYRCIPYLSRFYKVVRPDLRGMGRSSTAFDWERELELADFLGDFDAVADALGAEAVHYCGESLGGILGMVFAAERPARFRTLTLISSRVYLNPESQQRYTFGEGSWEDALRKLGSRGWADVKNTADRFAPGTDPGLMEWFAQHQGQTDVNVLIGVQRLAKRIDTTPYLSRIEAPVLTIYPSHGPITTPEQEELLRKHVRNLLLVHLPSRYHNLHLTQPAACARQLLYFAAQHDGVDCHE
ncbi:MAG: alpha/beta hydrolase [Betaproteobacteria bacterium]|nr:alpha/beta hydrolase [Betaproteobacteria bacterium]